MSIQYQNEANVGDYPVEAKEDIHQVEQIGGDNKGVAEHHYVVDPVLEKALVRKIDIHLMLPVWVMYCFNFLDRTNIGNAKTGGMQADLKLTSSQYSLILSIFFIGYTLFEIPTNMFVSRTKPSIFLPALMFVWGAMSIAVAGVHNLAGMVAFRLILGFVECGYIPGVMLVMSCWYKPYELTKRLAWIFSAVMVSGAFGGLLAGAILGGLEGKAGLRGWKWLFVIEGLCTCFVALVAFFIIPNYPQTTKWLTEAERELAVKRLHIREDLDVHKHISHKRAFLNAVKNPFTWVFVLIFNTLTISGTATYFVPTLMQALGYKGTAVQFMTVPVYMVAVVFQLSIAVSADYFNKRAYHLIGTTAFGCISFIVCVACKAYKVRYAFMTLGLAMTWTSIPLMQSWFVTSFDGRESRGIGIAIIVGMGNFASIYGSFIWPASDAPYYTTGFGVLVMALGVSCAVACFLKWKLGEAAVSNPTISGAEASTSE